MVAAKVVALLGLATLAHLAGNGEKYWGKCTHIGGLGLQFVEPKAIL